jgi:hypothetical protein
MRRILDELEANRKSRRPAWATLQRLRKFPGSAWHKNRDARRSELRDRRRGDRVGRFRDAALVTEKKDDFGNALQNLYRELERAEDLVGPG